VAATDEQARAEFIPAFLQTMNRIGRERRWAPTSEADVLHEIDHGAVYCGSPETVAAKIAATVRLLGAARFQLKYSVGDLPHAQRMESIRLFAQEVVPRVRESLS
jgi:alkanesulfonate monooxygenase SsuD/methylene tetrahydromethanopterin reductase-like flavin-dependent oxidoreductase (luciferase family)